ncbi:MAG TPA: hypothetical protein PKB10_10100 [Tepidisphaeraceae bacterium]|nr:hypothetical protein [Tepidisphaeraceae bacterium]
MDVRRAIVVREVSADESIADVVNEAKAMTWIHRSEHALLRIADGRLMLVRGGADGIELDQVDDEIRIEVDGASHKVSLLAWHTHPRPTGPSDHDFRLLQLLGQPDSRIYEMFGDSAGVRFYARHRKAVK